MNSLSAKSQNYMPLSWLLEAELLCFWWHSSLLFHIWSKQTPPNLCCLLLYSRVICLLVLLFPGFSLTLNRFTHSTFLDPVEEFFPLVLKFYQYHNKNLLCIFQRCCTTAHMWLLPCPQSLACLLRGLPVNHSSSVATLGQGWVRLSGKNRLALRALECSEPPRGIFQWWVHGQAFCWSCETVSREPHSSNAIWYLFLPVSRSGSFFWPVMEVSLARRGPLVSTLLLWQKNRLIQQHLKQKGNQGLTHYFPIPTWERLLRASSALSSASLRGKWCQQASCTIFSVSRLVVFTWTETLNSSLGRLGLQLLRYECTPRSTHFLVFPSQDWEMLWLVYKLLFFL